MPCSVSLLWPSRGFAPCVCCEYPHSPLLCGNLPHEGPPHPPVDRNVPASLLTPLLGRNVPVSRVPAGPTVSKVEGQSTLIRAPNGGPGIHRILWGMLTQSCIDRRGLSLLSQRIQQPGAAVGPKLCLPYVYGCKFLGIQGKVAPRWHVSQMVNVELALKNSHCEVWPVAHSMASGISLPQVLWQRILHPQPGSHY